MPPEVEMPKTNKYARNKILAKARQMAAELTQFARDELLLGFGERLRVTIEVFDEEAVDIKIRSSDDSIYDVLLTESDWEEVMGLPWHSIRCREHAMALSAGSEIREALSQSWQAGGGIKVDGPRCQKINDFLRIQGGKFRMVRQAYHLYELRMARDK